MSLRLEEIERIKQLKHRYFRFLDTADLVGLRSVLADSATTAYIGNTYSVELQGAVRIVDYLASMFHSEAVGCHTGHHPEITVHNDTEAEGIWYLTDLYIDLRAGTILDGSGIYRDRYTKVDGEWKIQHTGYMRIYERVEPYERRPNLTSHYLATKVAG
jgi:hypothetical protein